MKVVRCLGARTASPILLGLQAIQFIFKGAWGLFLRASAARSLSLLLNVTVDLLTPLDVYAFARGWVVLTEAEENKLFL